MAIFSRRKTTTPPLDQQRKRPPVSALAPTPVSPSAPGVSGNSSATHTVARQSVSIDEELERDIFATGSEFLAIARKKQGGFFSTQFWSDKLMDWAMKDEAFKIQFFRFVDTYPALKTPEQIHDHFVDYMTQPGVTPPPGMDAMTKAGGLAKGLFTGQMTKQITGMAKKFIAGENAQAASPLLHSLWKKGMCFSVDLLGEACISQKVADSYQEKYLDLINNLPDLVADFTANEQLESDHLGSIPRVNVSIKLTSMYWDVDPIDTAGSIDRLMERMSPLLIAAGRKNVHINFDIEQFEFKDLTLELFERCCEKFDFSAGLALQAYLRSGMEDAARVIDWSKRTGRQVTVRLVKGAYWDYETILAEQRGWPVPVWSRKQDSDVSFERMAELFIKNTPRTTGEGGVKLALGSHNARSIAAALAAVRREGLPDSALELQMLHGMGDPLKAAALAMGLRLREYLPVGELLVGMAYFVRRLLENTSNESWLRASFSDDASDEELLANPLAIAPGGGDPGIALIEHLPEKQQLSTAAAEVGDGRAFFNEPHRDFADAGVRENFATQINAAALPTDIQIGSDVAAAVAQAQSAFSAWAATPFAKRAEVLTNLARILRHRRDELAGMVMRSVGYTWREADAEICDAIDYAEFHARAGIDLFAEQRIGAFIGEMNERVFNPRGVTLCLTPHWHPLSTLTAMCSAALVTGNTVVVVPAAEVLGLAEEFRNILTMAGLPSGAVQFVTAALDAPTLLYHADIATVVYAGPREKGLEILQATGTTQKGQRKIKNIVAELGGKNALIVDTSADLGEAVTAVRQSAFSRAGQSPFACARVIVVDTAYDAFVERLIASTEELVVGNPLNPSIAMGPIVSAEAAKVIRNRLETAGAEGESVLHLPTPPASALLPGRSYIMPHIFTKIAPTAITAQEEIMGPVLVVIRAASFSAAIEIANEQASGYALCGGVYSRKPSNIEMARDDFAVGNLYINSPIASPRVGRQPVALLGLSGTANNLRGGADYLRHFVESRIITENTMRRGFAPEL